MNPALKLNWDNPVIEFLSAHRLKSGPWARSLRYVVLMFGFEVENRSRAQRKIILYCNGNLFISLSCRCKVKYPWKYWLGSERFSEFEGSTMFFHKSAVDRCGSRTYTIDDILSREDKKVPVPTINSRNRFQKITDSQCSSLLFVIGFTCLKTWMKIWGKQSEL